MASYLLSDTFMHLSLPAGFIQKMNSLCKMYTFLWKRHFGYFILIFCAGLL